jgi:hypothetical protein
MINKIYLRRNLEIFTNMNKTGTQGLENSFVNANILSETTCFFCKKNAVHEFHTTAETASGKERPAKITRKARSPISFSPMSRKLAKPLWTVAKTKRIINITSCKNICQKVKNGTMD